MQTITAGPLPYNPNWGVMNLTPFQYLIDTSEGGKINLPEISTLPFGVKLQFRLMADADQATLECSGEDDTFSNGTTNTKLIMAVGFNGSIILSVSEGQWNVTQVPDGQSAPIRITGLMRQTSTNAPIIKIASLLGDASALTPTPVYVGVGSYRIDFPVGTFSSGSVTTVNVTPNSNYSLGAIVSEDSVLITTQDLAGAATNALLNNASFIIESTPTV